RLCTRFTSTLMGGEVDPLAARVIVDVAAARALKAVKPTTAVTLFLITEIMTPNSPRIGCPDHRDGGAFDAGRNKGKAVDYAVCSTLGGGGHAPIGSDIDESAGSMLVGPAGAGLFGVRGLPRDRGTGHGTRDAVAALPSTRGVFRGPGGPRPAGNKPVRRHHRGTVAILGPKPPGLSSRPPRSGGAFLGLGRPPSLRSGTVGQVRRGRGLRPEPPPRLR